MEHSAQFSSGSGGSAALVHVGVLLTLILVALAVRPTHAAEPCAPAVGEIVSVEGVVELSRAARPDFERAVQGDLLCLGDAVRTGPLSRAAVALVNESVLRLDERTELSLRVSEPSERSLIEMVFGAIYFFSHRPRALQIDTPFVNAGAEGTEFLVRVGDDATEIVVYQGRVVAQNDQGELGLGSGDAAVATATTPPVPRTIVRPRDLVAWAVYYPPILPALDRGDRRALPEPLAAAARAVAEEDYPEALARLDEVPEPARDASYHTYRAGILLGVGRIEAANAAIDSALALDPDAGEALAQRSIIKAARNDVAAALADSQRAVSLSPGSSAAWIARSYALQAALRIEDAREALIEASRVAPQDALVFARLAEIELARGDLDAALEAGGRAVALEPDLARTQMVLGYAELVRIDTEDALEAFERAILLDQANPLPHLGRGLAIIREGDLEAGRRELEIAVALDPEDAVIRSYLGKAFFEGRRDERAAEQLEVAKRLDPNDPTPWFYNAIRLQLENRPVEALRDLETAIDLNDNRAVYRSSLLLDQDLATRSVSLARIYDDLGFDQLAVTEASRSLSRDPSNWSAHRFLSDAYARLPRHEIARVSELLQAQLLQPININPVQPSLAISDLNTIAGVGPAEAAFNEFHPLFERNRAQLTATGVVGDGDGNEDTLGDEVVASAVIDRVSLSAGQFHFQTDGFRANNDLQTDIYEGFAQWAVSPSLNLQAEVLHRETEQGDLVQAFAPDLFDPNDRRDLRQDMVRLGARYSFLRASELVLSAIYTERTEELELAFPTGAPPPAPILSLRDIEVEDSGLQLEGQVRMDTGWLNLVGGLGHYDIDVDRTEARSLVFVDQRIAFPPEFSEGERDQFNVYGYGYLPLPHDVSVTLGLAHGSFEQDDLELDELQPKLGVAWQINPALRLRGAAFRTLKRAIVADRTIEPTTIAGFNQFFDDINGTVADRFGIGLDAKLSDTLFAGIEGSLRELDVPVEQGEDEPIAFEDWEEQQARLYLYWAAHDRFALTADLLYDHFEADDPVDEDLPRDLDTIRVPLGIRYFDPRGPFAALTTTFLHQDLERGSDLPDGSESTVLVDAAIGYRLPDRRGLVSLEARNLLDEDFAYQDDNFRTSEDRISGLVPARVVRARLTLAF